MPLVSCAAKLLQLLMHWLNALAMQGKMLSILPIKSQTATVII